MKFEGDQAKEHLKIFLTITQAVKNETTASSIIDLLSQLSKELEIFADKSSFSLPMAGPKKPNKVQQNLFVQFILALNLSQFRSLSRQKNTSKYDLEKKLGVIVKLANQAHI